MNLHVGVTYAVQAGGWAIQLLDLMAGSGFLSPKGQLALAGAVSTIQAVVGILAHFSQPPTSAAK